MGSPASPPLHLLLLHQNSSVTCTSLPFPLRLLLPPREAMSACSESGGRWVMGKVTAKDHLAKRAEWEECCWALWCGSPPIFLLHSGASSHLSSQYLVDPGGHSQLGVRLSSSRWGAGAALDCSCQRTPLSPIGELPPRLHEDGRHRECAVAKAGEPGI